MHAKRYFSRTPTKIDDLKPFDRDAPGRRNISEKRKGHGDPNSIEFYQKLKHSKKDGDPLAGKQNRENKLNFHSIKRFPYLSLNVIRKDIKYLSFLLFVNYYVTFSVLV